MSVKLLRGCPSKAEREVEFGWYEGQKTALAERKVEFGGYEGQNTALAEHEVEFGWCEGQKTALVEREVEFGGCEGQKSALAEREVEFGGCEGQKTALAEQHRKEILIRKKSIIDRKSNKDTPLTALGSKGVMSLLLFSYRERIKLSSHVSLDQRSEHRLLGRPSIPALDHQAESLTKRRDTVVHQGSVPQRTPTHKYPALW